MTIIDLTDLDEEWLHNHCDFQENLSLALKVVKRPMPDYCSAKITHFNGIVNCIVFAMQPPWWVKYGVQSCVVPMNLVHSKFRKDCIEAYERIKEFSEYVKTRFASEIENGPKTNRMLPSMSQRNSLNRFHVPVQKIEP